MHVSNTGTGSLWNQPRTVCNKRRELLVITEDYWYQHTVRKNKIWLEERGHSEVRKHFSEKNILVKVPGDEHNTVQEHSAQVQEAKKQARTTRGGLRPPRAPENLRPISRKAGKNGLHVIPELHRKRKTYP